MDYTQKPSEVIKQVEPIINHHEVHVLNGVEYPSVPQTPLTIRTALGTNRGEEYSEGPVKVLDIMNAQAMEYLSDKSIKTVPERVATARNYIAYAIEDEVDLLSKNPVDFEKPETWALTAWKAYHFYTDFLANDPVLRDVPQGRRVVQELAWTYERIFLASPDALKLIEEQQVLDRNYLAMVIKIGIKRYDKAVKRSLSEVFEKRVRMQPKDKFGEY